MGVDPYRGRILDFPLPCCGNAGELVPLPQSLPWPVCSSRVANSLDANPNPMDMFLPLLPQARVYKKNSRGASTPHYTMEGYGCGQEAGKVAEVGV